MLKFRSGLFSRMRFTWASESIIMPTRPLVNSSTLSCSFMVKEPGAIDAGVPQALDVLRWRW